MIAIQLAHLSKTYGGGKQAVDDVSIKLMQGEIFGFLGPNGAGKTTTIKMLNGMLTSTSGSCSVFGIDPTSHPDHVHAISGVMSEHAQMYDHLTGLQNLVFYGSLYGLSAIECEQRGLALLKQLALLDASHKQLATYSTGMRQRLSLARACMHEPKILFLDEPTSGLDPESTKNVHLMIRDLAKEKGTTIFLCTHQLRYAQEICTRYGLMDQGHLLAEGTLDELRSLICSGIIVRMKYKGCSLAYPHKQLGDDMVEFMLNNEEDIPHIVQEIVECGGNVYHVCSNLPSLEDIYFHLTMKKKEVS